jgi:excisionase family DNA binding protein
MAADASKRPARLISVRDAASELSVSVDTVARLIRAGQLSAIRLPSGRFRIAREDLDQAIEAWREASR